MSSGVLSGLITLVLMIIFIGIVIWAYSSKRKKGFDEAARLALDEEDQKRARDAERTSEDDQK